MKARVLDNQVKVYSSMDDNAVSMATLSTGSEIDFSTPKRKAGKMWIPITLSTGQPAFIPGDTRLSLIRLADIQQDNVDLHADASAGSLIKQQLPRKTKVYILEVLKQPEGDWVRVRSMTGTEGYISGETRIRVVQQRTKANGRRNIFSGVMWLIAGLVIIFSNSTQVSGSGFIVFGYGAILFGAVMLISGIVQFVTAPS
jgi:hypothetical protein